MPQTINLVHLQCKNCFLFLLFCYFFKGTIGKFAVLALVYINYLLDEQDIHIYYNILKARNGNARVIKIEL